MRAILQPLKETTQETTHAHHLSDFRLNSKSKVPGFLPGLSDVVGDVTVEEILALKQFWLPIQATGPA